MFSIRLAGSELLQWFTGISAFDERKAISKSSLERYEKLYDEKILSDEIRKLIADLTNEDKAMSAEMGLLQSEIFINKINRFLEPN